MLVPLESDSGSLTFSLGLPSFLPYVCRTDALFTTVDYGWDAQLLSQDKSANKWQVNRRPTPVMSCLTDALHFDIKLSHTSYMVSNALVSYVLWGRACCGESESFGSLSMLPVVCLALAWPNQLELSLPSLVQCLVLSILFIHHPCGFLFELSSKSEICHYVLSRGRPSFSVSVHTCTTPGWGLGICTLLCELR